MATMVQAEPVSTSHLKGSNGVVDIIEVPSPIAPALLLVHDDGEEEIVAIFADVLGQAWASAASVDEVKSGLRSTTYGLRNTLAGVQLDSWDRSRLLINVHCIDGGHPRDDALTDRCDYEYLYTKSPFFRRDVARFLSFILGQIGPHQDLAKKARTTLISTTFPDVHAALPNLDILSVGADAIEIRVDLLEEPLPDGTVSAIPSLKYVGEQVMLLRQRTELPIIYTTRCMNENGRFPMDDPNLFYKYLSRAIQWGCEYIDVELWLPEDIRRRLAERKGCSKIISAFHDFSGSFRWTTPETQALFEKGAVYGDVVKMIALVNSMQENYELEYFRSTIQTKYPHPPFSGLNMGPMGQLSRTLNKIFTPITHPLLPMIAAPGQLSAAEINQALHGMGQMPRLDLYGIGSFRSTTQAMFFEKCFNELSLPHQFMFVERAPKASIENILRRPNFGGAYINPPLAASAAYIPALSDAARAIGQVDTVLVRSEAAHPRFVGYNATWKGIRATLSRDFVPSAYSGRAALLLANLEADAAAAIFALKSLGIGPVYTIGFKAHGSLAAEVEPVRSVEDVKRLEQPFVIISALPAEKSLLVVPLLKHYRVDGRNGSSDRNGAPGGRSAGKVFVDLANGPRKADPLAIATAAGWTAYGIADVTAWTTVETMRLLVGQNVPYDFVRLASGRGLF
ncbi:type I 3-dehydroquinase-domain-containing protein [Clohesyomyces aquaticus]|uniref:Type I 3-dehydroquinase-domain-containing protein n=1 Tax=Clohesyomyces aquaticus TaxID=1231657 RepID=A0A1Y1ZGG2_9PLEO|nr:type I 3-dehydroquinase-domain-containing protein [Clohesyomyces aquaticus]